jgi:hypothetical protein
MKVSKSSTPPEDASYNTPRNSTELQNNSRTGHEDPSNKPESSTEASHNASAPEGSHELLLAAPKSESTKPKDIESAQQRTDPLWATENEEDIDTDEETMNWLERELAKQNCEESIKSSNMLYASMPLPVEINMVAKETVKPHSHLVVPYSGKSEVIVHRGFGTFPPVAVLDERFKGYPPLSNAAYDLTTHGIDHNLRLRLSKKQKEDRDSFYSAEPVARPRTPMVPCIVNGSTPGMSTRDASILSLFVRVKAWLTKPVVPSSSPIDGDIDSHEFCNKCQKRHIEQGAPIFLDDRDTCRSMLPDWFPKDRFDRPWDAFINLNNKYVRLCHMMEGTEKDEEPDPQWQKEYHDSTPEWRAVGRHGGWWKCRIGSEESNPGVLAVERNCQVCHKRRANMANRPLVATETLAEQKKVIDDWIQKYMKKEMVKDRAYVLARIETEGY